MNFQCVYIIFSVIILVKAQSSDTKRIKFNKGGISIGTRSGYPVYQTLDFPQFNYYRDLLSKPFTKRSLLKLLKKRKLPEDINQFIDLTREDDYGEMGATYHNANKFSQDYIDISELGRNVEIPTGNKPINYKLKPEQHKQLLIDTHGNAYQVVKILDQIARRMVPYQQRSNLLQSNSDESASDSESDSQETSSKNSKNQALKNKVRTKYVPKRFQVINNNSEETASVDDEDDSEDEDQKVINIPIKTNSDAVKSKKRFEVINNSEAKSDEDDVTDEVLYVQAPTRHVKTSDVEWRRRLKHFLPKRVHWDENDFKNLRNYWFDGPRGRYPSQYKTPY